MILCLKTGNEASCRTCPEVMMPIRCSTADTLTDGCGCFRLRNSDVFESPINYTHKQNRFHLFIYNIHTVFNKHVNTRQQQIRS